MFPKTVGELRKATAGLSDDMPFDVWVNEIQGASLVKQGALKVEERCDAGCRFTGEQGLILTVDVD